VDGGRRSNVACPVEHNRRPMRSESSMGEVEEPGEPFDATDFERRAERYDLDADIAIPGYRTLHDLVAALLSTRLAAEARVLVVGAGTGMELATLGAAVPGWRLTGVDPSAAMLDRARRRIRDAGLAPRVDLHHGTIDHLPAAVAFDAATLLLVLHFMHDDGAKLALLRSVAERLVPGAPLLLADLHGEPGTPGFEALFRAWGGSMRATGAPDDEIAGGLQAARESVVFVSEARLAELSMEAGFGPPVRFWGALLYGGWICERMPV
jgi:tRNA (cmo5U34)-methyltransferase